MNHQLNADSTHDSKIGTSKIEDRKIDMEHQIIEIDSRSKSSFEIGL